MNKYFLDENFEHIAYMLLHLDVTQFGNDSVPDMFNFYWSIKSYLF